MGLFDIGLSLLHKVLLCQLKIGSLSQETLLMPIKKTVLILLEQNTLLSSAKNCHGKYRNLQIFPLDLSFCAVHNLYNRAYDHNHEQWDLVNYYIIFQKEKENQLWMLWKLVIQLVEPELTLSKYVHKAKLF